MDHTGAQRESQADRNFETRKMKMLTEEYYFKVSYDFTRYIFLGLKSNHTESLDKVINMLSECYGYEAHREIHYRKRTVHMYIRFVDYHSAVAAIEKIKQYPQYVVELVDSLLRTWYIVELMKDYFPWTVAIVNVEGPSVMPLNDVLPLLEQFGDPQIFDCAGVDRNYFQVLFSSMSEALGASIATGCWFSKYEKEKSYFTIKILTNSKEVGLVKSCLKSTADEAEAFQLDYFVSNAKTPSNSMKDHINAEEFTLPVETSPIIYVPSEQYRSKSNGFTGKGQRNHTGQRNKKSYPKRSYSRNSTIEESQEFSR